MEAQNAIDLGREALWMALIIASPMLAAALVVGLVVGLAQAVTQIQEQSLAFVPKLLIMGLVLCLALPWLIGQMVEYTRDVITNIPGAF